MAPLAAASSSASSSGGYSDQARRVLAAFGERLSDSALAVPKMCCAAFLALGRPLRQVVVATANKGGESRLAEAGMGDWTDAPLLNAAHAAFVPDKAVIVIDLLDEDAVRFFSEFNPEALAMAKRHFAVHPGESLASSSMYGSNVNLPALPRVHHTQKHFRRLMYIVAVMIMMHACCCKPMA